MCQDLIRPYLIFMNVSSKMNLRTSPNLLSMDDP